MVTPAVQSLPSRLRARKLALVLAVAGLGVAGGVPGALAHGSENGVPEDTTAIVVTPATATNPLGVQVTLTAAIINEEPQDCCGVDVTFTVVSGPNAGASTVVTSDSSGKAAFTYTSATEGTDGVQATFFDTSEGATRGSNLAQLTWQQASVGLAVPNRPVALVKPPGAPAFTGARQTQDLPKGTVVDIGGDRAISIKNFSNLLMTFLGVPDRVPSRFQLVSGVRNNHLPIVIKLLGGKFGSCSSRSLEVAGKKKPKKPIRRLWGSGKGRYNVTGHYASADIRGTFWEVADFCKGTFVFVRKGRVVVHDLVTHRLIVVTGGHSYFAYAPGVKH